MAGGVRPPDLAHECSPPGVRWASGTTAAGRAIRYDAPHKAVVTRPDTPRRWALYGRNGTTVVEHGIVGLASNRRSVFAVVLAAALLACALTIGASLREQAPSGSTAGSRGRLHATPEAHAGIFTLAAADATTARINAAIRSAARHRTRMPQVPSTEPEAGLGPNARQGVVRIAFDRRSPAFSGRNIVNLSGPVVMRSNVRFEVDSGVMLRFNRRARGVVIDLSHRRNVTVTVGDPRFGGRAHVAGNPAYPNLAGKFEIDTSRCPPGSRITALLLSGTRRFLVSDFYTVQASVTNGAAVIAHLAESRSGVYRDQYNSGSPFGYGPNQLTSLRKAYIARIWTDGGTALRLETGPTHHTGRVQAYGDHDIVAKYLYAQYGNRVVALAPHCADSADIHITGVYGLSDWEGIRLGGTSKDDDTPRGVCVGVDRGRPGVFHSTTVSHGCIVAGDMAQAPVAPGTFRVLPPRAESLDAISSDAAVNSEIIVRDIIADQSSRPFAAGARPGGSVAGVTSGVKDGSCAQQLPLTGW
jgi:hypothetical protein